VILDFAWGLIVIIFGFAIFAFIGLMIWLSINLLKAAIFDLVKATKVRDLKSSAFWIPVAVIAGIVWFWSYKYSPWW